MIRIAKRLGAFSLAILLAGCGATMDASRSFSQNQESRIFQADRDMGQPPPGYADLILRASHKTHLEGYYLLELAISPHGKPSNTFTVDIDGETETYEVQGRPEDGPTLDEQGQPSPEQGRGMKYVLERHFRLPAGNHRIELGNPGDQAFQEIDVTLEDGKSSVLEFKPRYRRYKWGREAFENGLCGYIASLHKD